MMLFALFCWRKKSMMKPTETSFEYNFVGTRARLLISGEQTSGAFSMMEFFAPPGNVTPIHQHENAEETLHILDGAVEAIINGEHLLLTAGQTMLFPRKVPHRLITYGGKMARYIVVSTPAGFEEFVDSCADAQLGAVTPTPPSIQDIERLLSVADLFGITLFPDTENY
jgi:quercetin dioxygenase-like cupin family protein